MGNLKDIPGEVKVRMFKNMIVIRLFEEKVKILYNEGRIVGAIHLCIGQEAIPAGVCEALRVDDFVFSTHRGHGHAIAKTGDINRIMAELMGRDTGLSRGHGGSMHLFDASKGLMGGNGIVGGGLPLSLGAAFSAQYRGTDQVSVVFFSDGAVNQGTFGESLNLAALFNLPVIFVCENNQYAATTHVRLSTAKQDIAGRARAYGVSSSVVNGNNVEEVYLETKKAVNLARQGKGPNFIECKTYRIEPHCGIIPDQRDRKEIESWKKRDPIELYKNILLKERVINAHKFQKMIDEAKIIIEKAVDFAINSPWPEINAKHNKDWMV